MNTIFYLKLLVQITFYGCFISSLALALRGGHHRAVGEGDEKRAMDRPQVPTDLAGISPHSDDWRALAWDCRGAKPGGGRNHSSAAIQTQQ